VSSYESTDPGSILDVAIFPVSGVADSELSESRNGYIALLKSRLRNPAENSIQSSMQTDCHQHSYPVRSGAEANEALI